MQISKDRKKRVIDLYYNQHKTYAEIAQIEHISPRDIHAIIKEEIARRQKHKDQELSAEAYKLFSEGKTTIQVATMLNLPASKVSKLYIEYWKLKRLHILNLIHKESNGKLGPFLNLYKELVKKRRMSIEQIANVVDIAIYKLPYMESLHKQVKEQVERMQYTVQRLANDVRALEYKISILDKTAFSIEQERKRTEQRVQKLGDKKDRLEKLIANILNNDEGYSKVKQIVKENIKVILSDNKILLSASFAAIIQTIKADPQMVKLIHNMSTTDDDKQHKGNNDNVTNYFKTNKDNLLDLAEKNYESLVEVLTNNAINAAAASNPTSSLRQPSTFPNLSTQSDSYRIEKSESFHHSKGDIAD